MTEPRAVLLDAGNTLFTEDPPRQAIYAEAARARGLRVTDDEMKALMSETHRSLPTEVEGQFRYSEGWFRTFIDLIFGQLGFVGDAAELRRELFDRFDQAETFRLFPETRPVIKRLKGAGVPMAIVSNWSPRLPGLLGRFGLARDFEIIVTSAIVRVEKPDPAIFRRAVDHLGVAPAECLHVGDRVDNDVEGARAAGLRPLLLDRDRRHPDHEDRIESLSDVLPRLGLPPI